MTTQTFLQGALAPVQELRWPKQLRANVAEEHFECSQQGDSAVCFPDSSGIPQLRMSKASRTLTWGEQQEAAQVKDARLHCKLIGSVLYSEPYLPFHMWVTQPPGV